MKETLAIVLPCFNEEGNIERTVRDVVAWMEEKGMSGEIIVVNDGSRDRTGEVLESMVRQAHHDTSFSLHVITHPTNLGYGVAVRSGCDAATTEWIGFMDSDGQFNPKDFDKLLPFVCVTLSPVPSPTAVGEGGGPSPQPSPAGRGGFDVVVGRRRRRADSFLRKVNAKLFGFLSFAILGIWVRDMNCAMKVFRRSAWEHARPVVATGALFNAEFFYNLKRAGIRWHQVDITHYPRRAGKQTGANLRVIGRMFHELWILRRQGKTSCVQRKMEMIEDSNDARVIEERRNEGFIEWDAVFPKKKRK